MRTGIKKVYCAGFDGYSEREDNFFNEKMEYQFIKKATYINRHIREVLKTIEDKLSVEFVTYSHYLEREED